MPKYTSFFLVLTGRPGVGKRSLSDRIILGNFTDTYDPTLEDSYRKMVTVDGEMCMIELMVAAGQEEYAVLREQCYRSGHGFFILYDICSRESFDAVRSYHEGIMKLKEKIQKDAVCCILGNKSDLASQRTVGIEEGEKLAEELGCLFEECSAKTGDNAEKGPFELIRAVMKQRGKERELEEQEKVIEEKKREGQEKERIKDEKRNASLWRRLLRR